MIIQMKYNRNIIKVKDFWNESSCGEELYLKDENKKAYLNQSSIRYKLEPYILDFSEFKKSKGKKVLEIGVGLGSDHQKFAEAGAELTGIDITERAIMHTANRLKLFELSSDLSVGNAENLQFNDNEFDQVYSWGVIHHSPNTEKAVNEIYRVLKKGGKANVMIYHKYSFVGYMLWFRYAFLMLKPFTSLKNIYANYLESPGTKAYSISESKKMFSKFTKLKISTILTHGDLLTSQAGQRHKGVILSLARILFPVYIIKKLFPKHGLFMLISASK
jgi:ubiquinone/menaquinone biosynthesis C-methylase UbiE